jgi:hypothetical protein
MLMPQNNLFLIMYILSIHNDIILMQPADDRLDWKNLLIYSITSVMVQNLESLVVI